MRFPALLSAKLAKARVAGFFQKAHSAPLIDFLDAAEVLHSGSEHPVSHEKIRGILDSPAPILWIGGSDPLDHPGIAHLVRAIAQSGRFVFLETSGTRLRRRIHEFQPSPQLFLTVRIAPQSPAAARDIRGAGAFELALEGLRAARLSGFFTAIHSSLREDSDLSQLREFSILLSGLDVDGWLITAACASDSASRKAAEARKLIPNSQWRKFSTRVERDILSVSKSCDVHDSFRSEPQPAQSREEGVHIS
jgi:MoaA/NifB/PqqE/SkfB family radical SAM enzyme